MVFCDWFLPHPITLPRSKSCSKFDCFFLHFWRRPNGSAKLRRGFWETNHNLGVRFGASQPITILKFYLAPANWVSRSVLPGKWLPRSPLWKRSVCFSMISLGKAFSNLGFNHSHAQHTSCSNMWLSSSNCAAFFRAVMFEIFLRRAQIHNSVWAIPQPWLSL